MTSLPSDPDPVPDPDTGLLGPGAAAVLRRRVDAAVDPRFEQAFAILDVVHAERQRDVVDTRRLADLQSALERQVRRLDHGSGR